MHFIFKIIAFVSFLSNTNRVYSWSVIYPIKLSVTNPNFELHNNGVITRNTTD